MLAVHLKHWLPFPFCPADNAESCSCSGSSCPPPHGFFNVYMSLHMGSTLYFISKLGLPFDYLEQALHYHGKLAQKEHIIIIWRVKSDELAASWTGIWSCNLFLPSVFTVLPNHPALGYCGHNSLPLQPGAGQNIVTNASPIARNCFLVLISKSSPYFLSALAKANPMWLTGY